MKLLVYFLISLFLFSCQQNKKDKSYYGGESVQETIRKINEQNLRDSLAEEFCACLIQDSLTNEIRLKKIDALLKRKVNINTPCQYSKSITYKSAGNIVQNVGASLSNFLLRTRISKKSSQKTIEYSYLPILMFAQDTNMVHAFINRGADVHLKTRDIMSLGQIWASEGAIDKLQLLEGWGIAMSKIEIGKIDEKTIEFLIGKGAKVENIDKVAFFESKEYKYLIQKYKIPLKDCSCEEFEKIVRVEPFKHLSYRKAEILLDAGVSVACVDTPLLENVLYKKFHHEDLDFAAKQDKETQKKWLKLLQKHKVNWNQCGSFDKSILVQAIAIRTINVVHFLLNNGATTDFKCVYGVKKHNTTPLEEAKHQVEVWKKGNWKKELREAEKILAIIIKESQKNKK